MPRVASIKRRADGLYQRSITTGRGVDGRPIRKTIYAKTIKDLEARAAEFERQLLHGILSSDEKMTFGALAEIWLRDYKPTVGVNTRRMYSGLLNNHLLPELSSLKLRDLKPHHLQTILNRLAANGYACKTLKEIKHTASQILELAIDNDVLFRNVFSKVDIPHVEAEERRALRQDETDLITTTYEGHRMGLPALLMLYCGIRRGELLALTWGDVNLKDKLLTVNKAVYFDANQANIKGPKTKAGTRAIPIPNILLPILQVRRMATMMVCPSASGEIMTQAAFKRA